MNGRQTQSIPEVSLPKAKELLRHAWGIYKKHFWVFVGIMATPYVVSLPVFYFGARIIAQKGNLIYVPLAVIFGFLAVVLHLWSSLALLYAVRDAEQEIEIKEAFRRAWGKQLPSFIWIMILAGLINIGGFFLLIIPFFLFAVWFSLASYVFAVEGHKGLSAILRSKEYVQGRWGAVAWRFSILALVMILISIAFSIVGSPLKVGTGKSVFDVGSLLGNILLAPFAVIYMFELYRACVQTRPAIAIQPVSGKKGFFIFAAAWGTIAAFVLSMLFALIARQ